MEAKLEIYQGRTITRLQQCAAFSEGLLEELDNRISEGATNLLLFQQLGPSVGKIAMQYQQILTQISLVKEDLSQLRT
jgi:DNA polymerase/3'-5' exonuclease PolX